MTASGWVKTKKQKTNPTGGVCVFGGLSRIQIKVVILWEKNTQGFKRYLLLNV